MKLQALTASQAEVATNQRPSPRLAIKGRFHGNFIDIATKKVNFRH
jgi:hypothetical protein